MVGFQVVSIAQFVSVDHMVRERPTRQVSAARIPENTDLIKDAKGFVAELARRSTKPHVKRGVPKMPGESRVVGPAYNSILTEFVAAKWRPDVASLASPSLARAIKRLREFRLPT